LKLFTIYNNSKDLRDKTNYTSPSVDGLGAF